MEKHNKTILIIRLLANLDDKTVKAFVRVAPNTFLKSMSEICYNILYGTFPLTDGDKKGLRRYKKVLTKLPKSKNNIKRQLISKKVGIFKAILSIWPNDTY